MKKIVALALTVVMVLGLLAGCEKPMDAKTLTQKMDEAQKNVTAVAGKMNLDLGMAMTVTGMTLDINMDVDVDIKEKLDMSAGYLNGKFTMEVMGESQEIAVENYVVAEGDKLVNYSYESATDMWVKSEQDSAELKTMQEELMGAAMKFAELPEEKMTLAEEQETVGGKSCYVLTVNMDGTQFQDSMDTIMGTMTEEMTELEELEAMLKEDMDWSALKLEMVYHVDAETFQIVQMVGKIEGMGEVINSLFATLLGELMLGEGAEELEFTIEVPTCSFSMTEMAYNDIEIPAVPQEAIDNAKTAEEIEEEAMNQMMEELSNPPQADGRFLLSQEMEPVYVTIPEGYIPYLSEEGILVAMTADMTESISYSLVLDVTAEDMNAEYEAMVQYAKEEGYYLSHEDMESVNGFTVKNLAYNDGSYETYAWAVAADCIVMVNASSFEAIPVLDDALNGISIGE